MLDRIPRDARIPVIEMGKVVSPSEVRQAYKKVKPFEKLSVEKRGWTLDVLNIVRSLRKKDFTLCEMYAHFDELEKLHPQNRHIEPKIRQQLQELRNMGILKFLGRGRYLLLS